jgi:hypothetical protein
MGVVKQGDGAVTGHQSIALGVVLVLNKISLDDKGKN